MKNNEIPIIVGKYIDRNFKLIKSRFDKTFQDLGIDLTADQWMLLDAINHHEVLSQNELAKISFKDTTTVSRIVDLLVNKDYVYRNISKTDRRRYDICLTPIGKDVISKVEKPVSDLRVQSWSSLSKHDYDQFKRIMDTIYANLQEKDNT